MRDFRDAKAMAHALRGALKDKSVDITHSESLELIAKTFGCKDWNILSAKIAAAQPRDAAGHSPPSATPGTPATLTCTFCGKSQHDVRTLIAGPSSYICDECVELCNDIIAGEDRTLRDLFDADETNGIPGYPTVVAHLTAQPSEEVVSVVERNRRTAQMCRAALQSIDRALAIRDGAAQADSEFLDSPRFAGWKDQSRDELLLNRQRAERGLRRSETSLRIALTVLGMRRQ